MKPPPDWRDPAAPHARSGTCTATHLLAPCPLYYLSRGTSPAAARIECSLAIGLPAQGGEKTMLSGAQRGGVGTEGGGQGECPLSEVFAGVRQSDTCAGSFHRKNRRKNRFNLSTFGDFLQTGQFQNFWSNL